LENSLVHHGYGYWWPEAADGFKARAGVQATLAVCCFELRVLTSAISIRPARRAGEIFQKQSKWDIIPHASRWISHENRPARVSPQGPQGRWLGKDHPAGLGNRRRPPHPDPWARPSPRPFTGLLQHQDRALRARGAAPTSPQCSAAPMDQIHDA